MLLVEWLSRGRSSSLSRKQVLQGLEFVRKMGWEREEYLMLGRGETREGTCYAAPRTGVGDVDAGLDIRRLERDG